MGQVLSIYLPQWDTELVRRQSRQQPPIDSLRKRPLAPLMLTIKAANQERVARCCEQARRWGAVPGMSVAEARALCPTARVLPFEPERSRESLTLLAKWTLRFSPVVAVDQIPMTQQFPSPDGLLLNVAGTAHLFGGEQLFLAEIATRLYRLGFSARCAIAPTIGAAWALARHGRAALSTVTEERLAPALEPLPIAALRLSSETCHGFFDLGIERISQLLRLPREGVLVRFGSEVLHRLDQAFGRMDERIVPFHPAEPLVLQRAFDGATTQLEAILLTVKELLAELAEILLTKESGLRGLRLELNRINNPPVSREIILGRPTRDPKHLWSLLHAKVEGMHLGYGVESVVLTAIWIESLPHGQSDIWADSADRSHDQALEALLDTLVNRWGPQRVLMPMPTASHVPEHAYRLVPVMEARKSAHEPAVNIPWLDRPSQLLERPEPASAVALQPDHPPRSLRWRGEAYTVLTGIGPERIIASPGASYDLTRDYFKVQLAGGLWLWVYHELETGHWFVHGLWA